MLERIVQKQRKINEQLVAFQPVAERVLRRSLIAIAKKFPQVDSFGWVQYTSTDHSLAYQVFEVQYLKVCLSNKKLYTCYGHDSEAEFEDDKNTKRYGLNISCLALVEPELYDEVMYLLETLRILEPLLQRMFGDQKEVLVTREGVESMRYDYTSE
jgi:hypothetical protein